MVESTASSGRNESSSPETNGMGGGGALALIKSTMPRTSNGLIVPSLSTSGYSETSPSPRESELGVDGEECSLLITANASSGETNMSLLTSSGSATLCQGEAEKVKRACNVSNASFLRWLARRDPLRSVPRLFMVLLPCAECDRVALRKNKRSRDSQDTIALHQINLGSAELDNLGNLRYEGEFGEEVTKDWDSWKK